MGPGRAQFGDLTTTGCSICSWGTAHPADSGRAYWYAMSKIAGEQGNIFEDARDGPSIVSASLSRLRRSRVLLTRALRGSSTSHRKRAVPDLPRRACRRDVDFFNRGFVSTVVANERAMALLYSQQRSEPRALV